MSASIHASSIHARASTLALSLSLTLSLSDPHTQVCDPCFYHGSHTFAYGTEMKTMTIDSLTERTVGRNDMAWGLMDEMVCKYGTCFHATIHECIDVCLCSVCHAHARSIHVCAFTNAHTLTFSPSVSISLCRSPSRDTRALNRSVSYTHFLARAHARSAHVCARAHTYRPSPRF